MELQAGVIVCGNVYEMCVVKISHLNISYVKLTMNLKCVID